MQGHTNIAIGGIIGRNEHTVSKYIQTFKTLGLDGLIPKKPKGNNSKSTSEQTQILINTINENTPDQVGLAPFKNWNCKLVVVWVLNEFEICYSITGITDLLHRLGLSYTRPTYVLAKADPIKQAEFKEKFETIKKTAE